MDEDRAYSVNVRSVAELSDSTFFLSMYGAIVKEYGIFEDPNPHVALNLIITTSMVTFLIHTIRRYGSVNKSGYLKTSIKLAIPLTSFVVLELVAWTDEFVPSAFPFIISMALHPIFIGLFDKLVPKSDATKKRDLFLWGFQLYLCMFYAFIYAFHEVIYFTRNAFSMRHSRCFD